MLLCIVRSHIGLKAQNFWEQLSEMLGPGVRRGKNSLCQVHIAAPQDAKAPQPRAKNVRGSTSLEAENPGKRQLAFSEVNQLNIKLRHFPVLLEKWGVCGVGEILPEFLLALLPLDT